MKVHEHLSKKNLEVMASQIGPHQIGARMVLKRYPDKSKINVKDWQMATGMDLDSPENLPAELRLEIPDELLPKELLPDDE